MKSMSNNFVFEKWSDEWLKKHLKKRAQERRLGEDLSIAKKPKFVVLGIKESIGPRANLGKKGAEFGFTAFCDKFLNMQSNKFLNAKNVSFLGAISPTFEEYSDGRVLTSELDEFVYKCLAEFTPQNAIPIVIGGGHNNAYPLIKWASKRFDQKIDVVNLDPHADYRPLEGRHSGNPFSYANKEQLINKYQVFGLHESYNSSYIYERLDRDGHSFTLFEEYLDHKRCWDEDFDVYAKSKNKEATKIGVELDMDAIENMPSSAISPSGVSFSVARSYIRKITQSKKVCYLHLPEGAPLSEEDYNKVGKALAYLVTDFIKIR